MGRASSALGAGEFVTATVAADRTGAREREELPQVVRRFVETDLQADVVHAFDLVSAVVALAAGRSRGWSVVVRAQLAGAPASETARRLWPVALRAADLVAVPTSEDAALARAYGASASRIVLCPDVALLAAEECASSGALQDGPVGAAEDEHHRLVGLSGAPADRTTRSELVRTLVTSPQARLLLLSPSQADRPHREELGRLAARHGVDSRLELRGRTDREDMLSVVRDAQAVIATRSDPTSALSALVAMHCAKPVIGVQSAAMGEVQIDGVTGRLVPPRRLASAVRETLTDEFRLLAWGFAGFDRVSTRYSPEQVGRSITGAYDRVAS